jgi:hypothetical protein
MHCSFFTSLNQPANSTGARISNVPYLTNRSTIRDNLTQLRDFLAHVATVKGARHLFKGFAASEMPMAPWWITSTWTTNPSQNVPSRRLNSRVPGNLAELGAK